MSSRHDPEAERGRLDPTNPDAVRWKWWGPYLAARQWGTVREDYSPDGDAWESFPYEHSRSRAYRWGEDGLGGICDRWQHLCFALTLWNGRDRTLKERLFGLTNTQGNHGEDVKEHWWALDSTPTHSYMRLLYKYPQAEFPYDRLVDENRRRDRTDPEFEVLDTGVFDDDRYFDVTLTYAKADPDDICIVVDCANRGPDPAPLHVLPTLWFRNTWAWGRDDRRPRLSAGPAPGVVVADHSALGRFWLAAEGEPELVFCENESNHQRLWGTPNRTPYPKDGINDHLVDGASTVNPAAIGTKAAAWYRLVVGAGETATLRLRLCRTEPSDDTFGPGFDEVVATRKAEADDFFAALAPAHLGAEARHVQRRAIAGLLWAKKHYRYDVREWLEGDPAGPAPDHQRAHGRNAGWSHLYQADIISLPDEWEYPWYAALGPGLPHDPDGLRRPRVRQGATDPVLPRVVHAPERAAARLRVGLRRRQPAGARVGRVAGLQDRRPEHRGEGLRVPRAGVPQAADQLQLVGEPQGCPRQQRVRRGVPGPGQHRRLRPLGAAARRGPPRAVGRHQLDGDVLPEHAGHRP